MGPIYDHLKHSGFPNGSRVIFFPQGGLALLPLQATWRNVDGRKKFFVDDYAFCSFPSFNVMKTSLDSHKESSVDQWSLLAVGDPDCDLRWAVPEAKAIAEIFRKRQVQFLTGKQASRQTLMKLCPEFTHIHFGGHGFHHLEEPLKSGLELADGDILSVVDIMYQLNLHKTRLVTLAACETAVTRLIRIPDEGLGIPFGLLAAGASAVVGSLWPQADEASSLFMVHFYRQLVEEGALPIDALRASQLWLRQASRQEIELFWAGRPQRATQAAPPAHDAVANADKTAPFASPYYWAGFSLVGW
jgi:CHAT domain-containing protein